MAAKHGVVPIAGGQYGWVMPPVKAGLRPPPAAADGLDRGYFPASLAAKRSTAQCGRQSSKRRANFFRAAIFARILTAIHNRRGRSVKSQAEPVRGHLARGRLRCHSATAKEYCSLSSFVARQVQTHLFIDILLPPSLPGLMVYIEIWRTRLQERTDLKQPMQRQGKGPAVIRCAILQAD